MNGITVMLRTKYSKYKSLQAIVEKLSDNTHVQRATKLERILQDTGTTLECDDPLKARESIQWDVPELWLCTAL